MQSKKKKKTASKSESGRPAATEERGKRGMRITRVEKQVEGLRMLATLGRFDEARIDDRSGAGTRKS
jgi:hypothetical protein